MPISNFHSTIRLIVKICSDNIRIIFFGIKCQNINSGVLQIVYINIGKIMNINPITYKANFGRAFTTEESKSYLNLLKDSRDELNLQDTSAIIFDFNIPSAKGENTAIGTTWSQAAKPFIKFIKNMTGIDSIQLEPQGKINRGNTSPYSGTTFAFGKHIIDLSKLTSKEYGNLLTEEFIQALDENYPHDKNIREYKTNYSYVLGKQDSQGIQDNALRLAFNNYKQKIQESTPEIKELSKEFLTFKKENAQWLEKEALFGILTNVHGTNHFESWNGIDADLYSSSVNEHTRQERIKELKTIYRDEIEFENFVQFLADKQQKESHIYINSEDISLYGDCLIGFSESEMWANKDCFRPNLYYGGPDPNCPETNYIQTWGLPALDYTKLGECQEDCDTSKLGPVGHLLLDKYKTFFKRYDGIRVDAAWQFITPFIYQQQNGNFEEVKTPTINNTIFNIMKAAAKEASSQGNIMLELVGMSADEGRARMLNKYPHLYSTAYAEYDETPAKFLQKGYKDGMFYTGVGNHDNDSLINMSRDTKKRQLHINSLKRDYNLREQSLKFNSEEYKNKSEEERAQEDFRTAKFAEIFTAQKQFFTLPDMYGMSERINISGKADDSNWTVRIPIDYEKFYFSQLSNGHGMNMPKILANAMIMKNNGNKNSQLISKCNEAAEILRQKGPMTQEEADAADKEGKLKHKFEYIK